MEQALRQAPVTVTVERVIAADPTSAALLVAGATTSLPRRLPTSYVVRFAHAGAAAVARLEYVADHRVATAATLTLAYDAPEGGAARLRLAARAYTVATAFLDDLAAAAEARADAA